MMIFSKRSLQEEDSSVPVDTHSLLAWELTDEVWMNVHCEQQVPWLFLIGKSSRSTRRTGILLTAGKWWLFLLLFLLDWDAAIINQSKGIIDDNNNALSVIFRGSSQRTFHVSSEIRKLSLILLAISSAPPCWSTAIWRRWRWRWRILSCSWGTGYRQRNVNLLVLHCQISRQHFKSVVVAQFLWRCVKSACCLPGTNTSTEHKITSSSLQRLFGNALFNSSEYAHMPRKLGLLKYISNSTRFSMRWKSQRKKSSESIRLTH